MFLGRQRWQLSRPGVGLLAILFCAGGVPVKAQIGLGGGPPAPRRPGTADPHDPEGEAEARRKKADKFLANGRELLAKGNVRRAIMKFRSVIELVGDEPLGQAAFDELMEIHRRGMSELEAAEQLYKDGEYRKALKDAGKCRNVYGGVFSRMEVGQDAPNIAKRAAKLIEKIEADPVAQRAIQEDEAQKRAKRIPRLEELAAKDPARFVELYDCLESIAERYPDTPTSKSCATRLVELKTDKKIWKLIRKEKKRRFIAGILQSVEQLERAGLHDKAAAEYARLTKKYPGKSREALKKMAEK